MRLRYPTLLLWALFGVAVAAPGVGVRAQDAPMDLHATAKPAKAKPSPTPAASPTPLSAAQIVARANESLDAIRMMSANFVQIGATGRRTEGQLFMERPGKMLFRYAPPAHLEIIADGKSVAVRDTTLGTEDLYFIWQTPLKFLLKDHIDLAKDTTILSAEQGETDVAVELEDKATLGGTSHLTLIFDPQTFMLKQWTVIDPQRLETVVSLFDVDMKTKPDPDLFVIPPPPIDPGKTK